MTAARYAAHRTDRGWAVQTEPDRYTVCVIPFSDKSGEKTAKVLADTLNAAGVPHQHGVLEALPPPPPTRLLHDSDPVVREARAKPAIAALESAPDPDEQGRDEALFAEFYREWFHGPRRAAIAQAGGAA